MSRVGVRPIKIEDGVRVDQNGSKLTFSFGNNNSELQIPHELEVEINDGIITVKRASDELQARAQHGLYARLIRNAIVGVKDQFTKELEFTGTGYRAAVNGTELALNMGYSHEIRLLIPEGLKVAVAKNLITVTGVEKDCVGQFAAKIRDVRPPEVYKGKGIRYKGEVIKRKAGKTAASK